jgi:OPT family oligopeptide transporter
MAIKQLTPEQVQTLSLEEKDKWWLENVYRGDMPQLTLRSGLTGFCLGGALSLTNLYIGARTGWSLGVGVTSVILSFLLFKIFSKIGVGKEMTVLENNAMQSIATSAGYMTAPLISSMAAYTMVTRQIIPMHVAWIWMFLLALLGVLFAFPMKKRFINDEQLPFPEGMAAGVVMDALHESDDKEGLLKGKMLVAAAAVASLIEFLRSEAIMKGWAKLAALPHYYDELLYPKDGKGPTLLGTQLKDLTIRFDTSIIFVATGGLMGIRVGASMLLGGILNYFILAPHLIQRGIILPNADGLVGFKEITIWALWGGVACMTTASLYAFFSKPAVIIASFKGLFAKKEDQKKDILEHIELPMKVSIFGIPVLGVIIVVLGWMWFDISPLMGALAIPLVFVFSLIAANSTALTAITPTSALGKLTQLTYGALAPGNIKTNIMTAGITAEVCSNTGNLLMDIKPGYMLGGKPRHQAIGHVIGAVAGLLVAIPVWYLVFIRGNVDAYGTEQLPMPSAVVWKAVSEVLMKGFGFLHPSAQAAVVVGALLGIAMEVSKQVTRNKFPLSAVGFGLAFVLRFTDIWTMFLGSFLFWLLSRRAGSWKAARPPQKDEPSSYREPPPVVKKPWYVVGDDNHETICAGVIAGGALTGVVVTVIETFFLAPGK